MRRKWEIAMKLSFNLEIHKLKPGMILAKDIYDHEKLLLAKGTVFKPYYIDKLKARGITKVSVHVGKGFYDEILSNPMQKFYAESYEAVGALIDQLKKGEPVSIIQILPLVQQMMENVFVNGDSMLLLTGFRGEYDYYYAHSLDVCIYSLITAKALNLDYDEAAILGMGALLHDVGKVKVPDRILFKQGSLTVAEFEEVKKHSRDGYEIVSQIYGLDPKVAEIVLRHHERCDGSGYPDNLKSDALDTLTKLVSIADIYDALTSDRVYNKKILPHEAAEYLICISGSLIDSDLTKIFLQNVAIYPQGCQVLLNTNEVAIVLDSNPAMPLRPLLKIITDKDRNPLLIPVECALQSHPTVLIAQIFN